MTQTRSRRALQNVEVSYQRTNVSRLKVENGRALCVQESDGFWMYGVNPGAMAAHGESADAARSAFREMFSNILKDFMQESDNYDAFREMVRAFVFDANAGYEREWKSAVDFIQQREIEIEGLDRVPANSRVNMTIRAMPVNQVNPADNEADLRLAQAA